MITTIIFDLGDVYIRGMKGIQEKISGTLGEIKENILTGEKINKLFRGEITEDEFWNMVIEENQYSSSINGYGSTHDFLKSAVRENFKRIEGAEEIIRKLKDNGYHLVLFSDHAKEWIEYCEKQFPLRELFEILDYSFEEGITKKDYIKGSDEKYNKRYERVLEKSNANPETTLYIDDKQSNLNDMQSVGVKYVHLFSNACSLDEDLRSRGLY